MMFARPSPNSERWVTKHTHAYKVMDMDLTRTGMSELLTLTTSNGGATYTFEYGVNPAFGYSVGNGREGYKTNYAPKPESLLEAARWFEGRGYDGLGLCIDEGYWYITPILHVTTYIEAMAYAALWGEKAIYDLQHVFSCRNLKRQPSQPFTRTPYGLN